jgi:hypothetical protein
LPRLVSAKYSGIRHVAEENHEDPHERRQSVAIIGKEKLNA